MENLAYRTAELERYFSQNRVSWPQFYESERKVIEAVWPGGNPDVLDIGCGCGGLGLALQERFGADRYTGIEINHEAAASARQLNPRARILSGDFLDLDAKELPPESFDLVFSLSCIDWNLNFDRMLARAWSMVRPGGDFLVSLRLTTGEGVNDIERSYQFINYEGRREGEIAPYVVLNCTDIAQRMVRLGASRIYAYGYHGAPSATAITPFAQLCFAAIALRKPAGSEPVTLQLHLPEDIAGPMAAAVS